jgi:hypothetical protein
MKPKNVLRGISIAVAMQLGVLAASAQTNKYLFTGSETNITLPPGIYNITAYGAQGGGSTFGGGGGGGSIIDSSAITNLVEVSGIASPDGSHNGEIIITTVSTQPPPVLGISTYGSQPAVFFPTATGTNYVLQMTTNLASGPWVTVSNGVPISGIIISNPPAAAFFRLH